MEGSTTLLQTGLDLVPYAQLLLGPHTSVGNDELSGPQITVHWEVPQLGQIT